MNLFSNNWGNLSSLCSTLLSLKTTQIDQTLLSPVDVRHQRFFSVLRDLKVQLKPVRKGISVAFYLNWLRFVNSGLESLFSKETNFLVKNYLAIQ